MIPDWLQPWVDYTSRMQGMGDAMTSLAEGEIPLSPGPYLPHAALEMDVLHLARVFMDFKIPEELELRLQQDFLRKQDLYAAMFPAASRELQEQVEFLTVKLEQKVAGAKGGRPSKWKEHRALLLSEDDFQTAERKLNQGIGEAATELTKVAMLRYSHKDIPRGERMAQRAVRDNIKKELISRGNFPS